MFNFVQAQKFKDAVTFIPNKNEPMHNWFYYKEGFSKQLADFFIRQFKLSNMSLVFDPFCGSGTTLLSCKQLSIPSIGIDANPLLVFVSKVKTTDYDLGSLEEVMKLAGSWKFERPKELPKNPFYKKAFSRYALEDLVFLRNKIGEISKSEERDFLLLALIDSAVKGSYTYKDGAVLKIFKNSRPPVRKLFKNKIHRMLKDLQRNPLPRAIAKAEEGDARSLTLKDEVVDAVITSPPYLNKIEYTKVYRLENSLLGLDSQPMLPSHIGSKAERTIEGLESLPIAAQTYFADMSLVLAELHRVCKPSAPLAVVVGGGCFPTQAVNADEILASTAERTGFAVESILVARNSWCTRARTIKVGQIRESIIILKKP